MTEDDYKFIEEKIKPQKLRKATKGLKKLGFTAILAIVFGGVAAGAFYLTNNVLGSGQNAKPQPTVSLPKRTEAPAQATAEPTKEPSKSVKDDKQKLTLDITDYSAMYQALSDYCKKYNKTIVTVAKTKEARDYFQTLIDNRNSFSGLVLQIDKDLMYVLTEYDDIEDGIKYQIIFHNEETVDAKVLGTDEGTGLAVVSADISGISPEAKEQLRTAELGYSEATRVGEMIVALGNPMGNMYSIDYGIVNSEPVSKYLWDREVVLFGTDIAHVDSGSGVIMNTSGKVIGFLTHRFDSGTNPVNASFVGITEVKGLIEQLMNNENRGRAGVIASNVGTEYLKEWNITNGVFVTEVATGSPAMEAGVSVGDVIMSVQDKPVEKVMDLTNVLSSYHEGEEIKVKIHRTYAKNDTERNITIKLGEVDPESSYK